MAIRFTDLLDKISKDKIGSVLNLSEIGFKLTDDSIEQLAEALIKNRSITDLNLFYGNFGKKGTLALAKVLRVNTSFTAITLGINTLLGTEEIKLITEALKNNTSLSKIRLDHTKMGTEGAKLISDLLRHNTTVQIITLHGNDLGYEGTKAIAEMLKHNSSLTEVGYSHNKLENESTKLITEALKHNTSITHLDLSMNRIFPEGAQHIAELFRCNTSITSIRLASTDLWFEGFKHIVDALKHNNSLTHIDLSVSQLGQEAGDRIIDMLKYNYSLTSIKLEYTYIGLERKEIESEINLMLERNKVIHSIRKQILSLSPTSPLPTSSKSKDNEAVEIDIHKQYQTILFRCALLERQDCPDTIIQALKAEALLSYYSWDQGDELTVEERAQGALTTQERLDTLQMLCKSTTHEGPFKKKILSQLSDIAFHLGMINIHKSQEKEAKEHFLLAGTCALHAEQTKITKEKTRDALAFWMGREMCGEEETQESLMASLAKTDFEKFKELQTGYQAQCEVLGLTPLTLFIIEPLKEKTLSVISKFSELSLNTDRKEEKESKEKQEKTTQQFELHKQSDKISAASSGLTSDINVHTEPLGLDADTDGLDGVPL